jgi:hypothetical protein
LWGLLLGSVEKFGKNEKNEEICSGLGGNKPKCGTNLLPNPSSHFIHDSKSPTVLLTAVTCDCDQSNFSIQTKSRSKKSESASCKKIIQKNAVRGERERECVAVLRCDQFSDKFRTETCLFSSPPHPPTECRWLTLLPLTTQPRNTSSAATAFRQRVAANDAQRACIVCRSFLQ